MSELVFGLPRANAEKVYFTSDTHLSHARIMDLVPDTRRFESVGHMNQSIINEMNRYVPVDGTLFHLGDVALGGWKDTVGIFGYVDCENKVLIPGNHDVIWPGDKRHGREDVKRVYGDVFDNKVGENVLWLDSGEGYSFIPMIGSDRAWITMSHFPMVGLECDERHPEFYVPDVGQVAHLCGHVHDKWSVESANGILNINVGWDAWERPISLAEIVDTFRLGSLD